MDLESVILNEVSDREGEISYAIFYMWKQPRCPSADEWIRKMWYIYTMEYYSAIKKNTFESVLMRWMKLEPIINSEVSPKETHQFSILTHMYGFTFHFRALEKEMATHSSVLACGITGTGEPCGLPSMGSHRVRHVW